MSEYGLKINNYLSGVLYSYNLGIRRRLDSKPAMLTNSLFLDYLKDIGIKTYKGESTRDVICIEFTCGSKSYDEEMKASKSRIKDWNKSFEAGKIDEHERDWHIGVEEQLQAESEQNKDKYVKKSYEDIRIEYYRDGVGINYHTYDSGGNIKKTEYIHYKMLYRTAGKAKKGSCMFIRDELYDKAHEFLTMGIQMPADKAPIVEMGAYSSLITSSIVGKIQLRPEEIFVFKDIDSFLNTDVVYIDNDEEKKCRISHVNDYPLKNTMFDGQAMIDSSIFPSWGDGYILLRHHMCKMAAFNTNIQLFFKDYFGDKYDTAELIDMFGKTHKVKDIKLITTENAMKWRTFNITYDYWLEWIAKNDCMFGIVKTAHESKLGEVQRMSYQMVNALNVDDMDSVLECSRNFVYRLKNDDEFFLQYLKDNINFSNDYEALVALCGHNSDFINCDYFRDRRHNIIKTYVMDLKIGKLIQPADNLVILGSPYAMLLASVGEDVELDDTFKLESDCIQCYTGKFDDGEYLAGFRSPFNGRANMDYLLNHYDDRLKKYFNLGKQIIAVNMLHTQFQDKNNGSDQDSDSLYVTNQESVVKCAKYCFNNYPTIVNNIDKDKKIYTNTPESYALIDNELASYQNAIGTSSNLAQICLTYTYNYPDKKYEDYVCLLSVLAQVAIDNAKRKYCIDLNYEIENIKNNMNIDEHGYPAFYADVQNKKRLCVDPKKKKRKEPKKFNSANINRELICPMNCISSVDSRKDKSGHNTIIPISDLIVPYKFDESKRRKAKKVEELIEKYSKLLYMYNVQHSNSDDDGDYILLKSEFENMMNDIRNIGLSKNYTDLISWLLNRGFKITKQTRGNMDSKLSKNKALLLKVLYDVNKSAFLSCFVQKSVGYENYGI